MKFGSNATPSKPRSPDESTVTVKKGVASRTPFLMRRKVPPCSQTKIRPSGANAIAGGLVKPPATSESVNPGGTVAAEAILALLGASSNAATNKSAREMSCPDLRESLDSMQTPMKKGRPSGLVRAVGVKQITPHYVSKVL